MYVCIYIYIYAKLVGEMEGAGECDISDRQAVDGRVATYYVL